MDNKLLISPLALKELEESSEWYEERVAGLGEHFIEVIYNSLTLVSVNPTLKRKLNIGSLWSTNSHT